MIILNESLQICLLALASRYPVHSIEVRDAAFETQGTRAKAWDALKLLVWLQGAAPELLQAPARMEIGIQKSEIYLLEHSQELPALTIHCQGNVEGYTGKIYNWYVEPIAKAV